MWLNPLSGQFDLFSERFQPLANFIGNETSSFDQLTRQQPGFIDHFLSCFAEVGVGPSCGTFQ